MNLIKPTLLWIGIILLWSCEKTPSPLSIDSKAYFKAKINNIQYQIQADNIGNLSDSSGTSTYNTSWGGGGGDLMTWGGYELYDNTNMFVNSQIANYANGEGLTIYFLAYIKHSQLLYDPKTKFLYFTTVQQFKDWLLKGPHSYVYDFASTRKTGIAIHFLDKDHNHWSTSTNYGYFSDNRIPPVSSYEGNTFEVVSVEEYPQLSHHRNNPLYRVKIKFSCKLYNEKGNYIQVKDGEFVGFVESFSTKNE